jgi:hypothetical protein
MATQATNEHRARQEALRRKGSALLNRLIDAGMGELEMPNEQVAAARIALAKILPDLRAIEHSGETVTRIERIDVNIIK